MLGLLVTGHGHFATGLNSSLELIAGAQPNVALVDFEADHSIETLKDNLAKALDLYTQSAEKGYSFAQYNVGYYYANGWGVEVDYAKAVKCQL